MPIDEPLIRKAQREANNDGAVKQVTRLDLDIGKTMISGTTFRDNHHPPGSSSFQGNGKDRILAPIRKPNALGGMRIVAAAGLNGSAIEATKSYRPSCPRICTLLRFNSNRACAAPIAISSFPQQIILIEWQSDNSRMTTALASAVVHDDVWAIHVGTSLSFFSIAASRSFAGRECAGPGTNKTLLSARSRSGSNRQSSIA